MKKKYKLRPFGVILTRFILFFVLFCVTTLCLSAFKKVTPFSNSDELYQFQWGLHGASRFSVARNVIRANHDCMEYNDDANGQYIQSELEKTLGTLYSDTTRMHEVENLCINFEEAYNMFNHVLNKKDIIVAIIDSGVDINHPELVDSIWTNTREIPNNGIDDDGNGYIDDIHGYNFIDDNGNVFTNSNEDIHGTHSAGIISAKHYNGGIKGIAYDSHVKIMPIKILGENGTGKVSNFIKAVEYAEKNGASICNVSLGSYTYKYELDKAVKNSKMLFVVACGNGENYAGYNIDDNKVFPASFDFDNMIVVGNISFEGQLYESSNYGMAVTVAAPGTMILSTIPDGKYGYITGTSMAAPFVTGVCAMIMSSNDRINTGNIKNIILNSVDRLDSLSNKVKTSGILNAYKAMQIASLY